MLCALFVCRAHDPIFVGGAASSPIGKTARSHILRGQATSWSCPRHSVGRERASAHSFATELPGPRTLQSARQLARSPPPVYSFAPRLLAAAGSLSRSTRQREKLEASQPAGGLASSLARSQLAPPVTADTSGRGKHATLRGRCYVFFPPQKREQHQRLRASA